MTPHPPSSRIAHRARRETHDVPTILDTADLRERFLAAGAHDVGFVDLANPAIDDQCEILLAAFPRTQALVSFVVRMNREDMRTPPRSVPNARTRRGTWIVSQKPVAGAAGLGKIGMHRCVMHQPDAHITLAELLERTSLKRYQTRSMRAAKHPRLA